MKTLNNEMTNLTIRLGGGKPAIEGRRYNGMLSVTANGATFVEGPTKKTIRTRPQRIYEGKHITLTCNADGVLRFNFRCLPEEAMTSEHFALHVYSEVDKALKLIGNDNETNE